MTDKELKKLSRAELLELLLLQTKEVERLQEKLAKAESLLSERYLHILESGNLAEAVLKINGVMEAAQAAAQQYIDNIVMMERETEQRCKEKLAQAEEEARRISNCMSDMPEDMTELLDTEEDTYI